MVAAFESLASLADKVDRVFAEISSQLQSDPRDPVCVAGRKLAAEIDSAADCSGGNAYHNPQHFCEVMLSAHFLCTLRGMSALNAQLVVLSALIHDFHHDGSVNGSLPFRLERLALEQAEPYLRNAGVSPLDQRRVCAMVLATDLVHGLDFAIACHAYHTKGKPLPPLPEAGVELALLIDEPLTSVQALVLCQADLLPSTALTPEHAMRMQDRLSQEWGKPLEPDHKLQFLERILSSGVICSFFVPNVQLLRQTLRRQTVQSSGA